MRPFEPGSESEDGCDTMRRSAAEPTRIVQAIKGSPVQFSVHIMHHFRRYHMKRPVCSPQALVSIEAACCTPSL